MGFLLTVCLIAAVLHVNEAQDNGGIYSATSNCTDSTSNQIPYLDINCEDLLGVEYHEYPYSYEGFACKLDQGEVYSMSLKFTVPCGHSDMEQVTLLFSAELPVFEDNVIVEYWRADWDSITVNANDSTLLEVDPSCSDSDCTSNLTQFKPGCVYQIDQEMPEVPDVSVLLSPMSPIYVNITIPDPSSDKPMYCVAVDLIV